MSGNKRLVVIGGVAAGMSAASSFKRIKPEAEAIVLEKDYFISYGACSLPYYISDDVKDFNNLISLSPEMASKERGITVLLRHEATGIDPAKKEIYVKDLEKGGMGLSPITSLLSLPGSANQAPFPGIDLEHVFTIRTLIDGIEIKKFINEWTSFDVCVGSECAYMNRFGAEKRTMKAVIVGGGYIGMEMCESLRKRGLDVIVIEKNGPRPRQYGHKYYSHCRRKDLLGRGQALQGGFR